jgi:hypothetical protein
MAAGILYVVATPIGNLADLSARAIETLRGVDAICAEDTRHSRPLLAHHRIERALIALHEHNESEIADKLVARMLAGESLALISDAGTPLVSDPGYRLVRVRQSRLCLSRGWRATGLHLKGFFQRNQRRAARGSRSLPPNRAHWCFMNPRTASRRCSPTHAPPSAMPGQRCWRAN